MPDFDKRPEPIGDVLDHWKRLQTWALLRLLTPAVGLTAREIAMATDAADELAAVLLRERGL